MVKASTIEPERIQVILMVGKLYGWSYQYWATNHLWRKRHALGGKHQNQTLGLYLLQASVEMLRSLVATVFLHFTKCNALGINILHTEELQGEMNEQRNPPQTKASAC